jgi:hypothetical protein
MSKDSLSASGERAGVRGFQRNLYLLIHTDHFDCFVPWLPEIVYRG